MIRLKPTLKNSSPTIQSTFLNDCIYENGFKFQYKKLEIQNFFPRKKLKNPVESTANSVFFLKNDLGFLHVRKRDKCYIYDSYSTKQIQLNDKINNLKNFNNNFYLIFSKHFIKIENNDEQLLINGN